MFREFIDYDIELEEKILGVFLVEPHSYSLVFSILREECFYGAITLEIYKAIKDVYEKGYGIDYLVVQRFFFNQGITQIDGYNIPFIVTKLQTGVYSSAHLVSWCLILRDLTAKRLMYRLKNSGPPVGDTFEEMQKMEDQLRDIRNIKITDDWIHISEVAKKLLDHMDSVKDKELLGISTSIPVLDKMNSGFRETQLIVIGARPSVGKSAFMGKIAAFAAFAGKTVGIISLEMDDKDILARNVSAESDIDHWRIDRNAFDQEDEMRQKVYATIGKLSTLPIYFSDTAQVNITDIRAKAERLRAKKGMDLLVIDYLQLIETESAAGRNRQEEVAKITRGLKILAMNMKIPIIILAQLNRVSTEKADKKPDSHHLRESGSIEQDADVIILLHSDWYAGIKEDENGRSTEGQVDILVTKWRNGAKTEIKLNFHGPTMKFSEYRAIPDVQDYIPQDKPNTGFQNRKLPPAQPDMKDDLPF